MAQSHGIALKKKHGQNFLRDHKIVEYILNQVTLDENSSVFEIGCGDGFLTREIIKHPLSRLWVFEIDPEWAAYVANSIADPRVTIFQEDILQVDFARFEPDKPWTLLANLPYHITFAILDRLKQNWHLLKEGVIMVQEEVAQKILKTSGRGYGFLSLYFQYYFDWKLLQKVSPTAFLPPPKVYSRLLYFKPAKEKPAIPDEIEFWKFIKRCFASPRRTLKNNLQPFHYPLEKIAPETLALRAQQMIFDDFLKVWQEFQTNK